MTEPGIQDPQLAAFWASDPSRLQAEQPPPDTPRARHARQAAEVAIALAAAFLVVRTLVARDLQRQDTAPEDVAGRGLELFKRHLPTWMSLAVPAIRRAYQLGDLSSITEAELQQMASAYAADLGDYLNTTSAQALADGFNQQLAARWSERLAWQRSRAGYGLDSSQTRSYIAGYLTKDRASSEIVPDAARAAVDKALILRADRLGQSEGWRAIQAGRAIIWLLRQQAGDLPATATKRWIADAEGRLCPICGPLADTEVGLAEMFLSGDGQALFAPGAHPNCHCQLELVLPMQEELEKRWQEEQHPRRRGRFVALAGGVAAAGLMVASRGQGRRLITAVPATVRELEAPRRGAALSALIDSDLTDVRTLQAMDDEQLRTMMRHVAASTTNNERYQRALAGVKGATGHLQGVVNGRDLADDYPLAEVLAGYGASMKDRGDLYLRMLALADARHTPGLHRGMHGVEHEVGDLVDMRAASSFSVDRAVADLYADALSTDQPRGIYSVPAGEVSAVPFSGPEGEWLTGGLFRVAAKTQVASNRHHYRLERAGDNGDVIKAFDPHEPRHPDGRWAPLNRAAGTRPTAVRTRDAFIDTLMEQARAIGDDQDAAPPPADPLASKKNTNPLAGAADPLRSKRLAPPAGDPLGAKGDPLGGRGSRPGDPLASHLDPLASTVDPLAAKPAAAPRRVLRRRVVIAPPFPRRKQGRRTPYYLPAEDLLYQLLDQNGEGEFFDDYPETRLRHGDTLDFGEHHAEVTDMYDTRRLWHQDGGSPYPEEGFLEREGPWAPPSPVTAVSDENFHHLVSAEMDGSHFAQEEFWNGREHLLGPIRQAALDNAGDVVDQLSGGDLGEIFYSAGYETGEHPARQRDRIRQAAQIDPTSSLAAAYADYVAFSEPQLAGANGHDLGRSMDAELGYRPNPVVPEVFVFDDGFTDADAATADGRAASLTGEYVVDEIGYHSAHDLLGADAPAGIAGYRLLYLKPSSELTGPSR